MRTIAPELQAALPSAAGNFIAKVQLKRAATSETITTISGFEIDEGNLTAWVKVPTSSQPTTVNPTPNNNTIFQISRGFNILGTDYYLASSWFILQTIEYDDENIKYHGHIFKSIRHTTPGDETTQTIIADILANSYISGLSYTNTISYPTDTPWWKNIQFYPDGRTLVLQSLHRFNNLLGQKYILNLYDIGGNVLVPHDNGQINQYEPIEPTITPLTTIVSFKYKQKALTAKYYIWRDETNSIHTSGSNNLPAHNLGYIESTVTPYTLDEYDSQKSTVILSPPDLRLTVQDYIHIVSHNGAILNNWFRIKETFDPKKTYPWFQTLEAIELLANTEGGPMPSTLEAAAPYTPLNTSNFNNILDENDNNLQAAMETIDDHGHISTDVPAALKIITNRSFR